MPSRRTALLMSFFALLCFTTVAQAATTITIVGSSGWSKSKQFGNQITPLGGYQLQGDATTTLTFTKIEVKIEVQDPATKQYGVYNNLAPQQAMVTGNNYSAAAYINLPAGTYRITHTLYYKETVNGVTTDRTIESRETFTF